MQCSRSVQVNACEECENVKKVKSAKNASSAKNAKNEECKPMLHENQHPMYEKTNVSLVAEAQYAAVPTELKNANRHFNSGLVALPDPLPGSSAQSKLITDINATCGQAAKLEAFSPGGSRTCNSAVCCSVLDEMVAKVIEPNLREAVAVSVKEFVVAAADASSAQLRSTIGSSFSVIGEQMASIDSRIQKVEKRSPAHKECLGGKLRGRPSELEVSHC